MEPGQAGGTGRSGLAVRREMLLKLVRRRQEVLVVEGQVEPVLTVPALPPVLMSWSRHSVRCLPPCLSSSTPHRDRQTGHTC